MHYKPDKSHCKCFVAPSIWCFLTQGSISVIFKIPVQPTTLSVTGHDRGWRQCLISFPRKTQSLLQAWEVLFSKFCYCVACALLFFFCSLLFCFSVCLFDCLSFLCLRVCFKRSDNYQPFEICQSPNDLKPTGSIRWLIKVSLSNENIHGLPVFRRITQCTLQTFYRIIWTEM